MKNKKLNFTICGIITLLILAGAVWFLCEWIPQINVNEHIIELVVIGVTMLLLFLLAVIFFYNTTAHSARFVVKKGFNTAFSLIIFLAALLTIAFGVTQIVSYYNASEKIVSVLTYGIASVVIGLVAILISIFVKRKNLTVANTESKLKQYEKGVETPVTFNDKKVIKTCEFCGCRLKPEDKNCPNCQGKIK